MIIIETTMMMMRHQCIRRHLHSKRSNRIKHDSLQQVVEIRTIGINRMLQREGQGSGLIIQGASSHSVGKESA